MEQDKERNLFGASLVSGCFSEKDLLVVMRKVFSTTVTKRDTLKAQDLARVLNIGLETAYETTKVTTQKMIRNAVHPLQRRFRTMQ